MVGQEVTDRIGRRQCRLKKMQFEEYLFKYFKQSAKFLLSFFIFEWLFYCRALEWVDNMVQQYIKNMKFVKAFTLEHYMTLLKRSQILIVSWISTFCFNYFVLSSSISIHFTHSHGFHGRWQFILKTYCNNRKLSFDLN